MVVFKSRKVKKVKKLKKKKTIHTKYKHHHRTLKQPKHKSYNATQSYYNVNNRLAGVQDSVSLEVSINELHTIALEIFIGNINDSFMNECLTNLFFAYENIETYEDKLKFIDTFNTLFINNYINNPEGYKHWFKYIITRIEADEIDYANNYDTTPRNSVIQLLLFDEITKSKTMIDSAQ